MDLEDVKKWKSVNDADLGHQVTQNSEIVDLVAVTANARPSSTNDENIQMV